MNKDQTQGKTNNCTIGVKKKLKKWCTQELVINRTLYNPNNNMTLLYAKQTTSSFLGFSKQPNRNYRIKKKKWVRERYLVRCGQ